MPRLPKLPLQYLAAFQVAARAQNLRVAAQELHLTHSAVSQQIRSLEGQLGFLLFERRGRRLVLNASGQALLSACERAMITLDEGLHAAMAAQGAQALRLRLTVLPSIGNRWLVPRLASWREANPDIALEMHASPTIEDLGRQGFHAGLRHGIGPWEGLHSVVLASHGLRPIASPATAWRLAQLPKAVQLDALAREPLLGDASRWARWFLAAGKKIRITPVASFNDATMLLTATEQGMGIALSRPLLAGDAIRSGLLAWAHDAVLQDQVSFQLVYPEALAAWPPIHALSAWLRRMLVE